MRRNIVLTLLGGALVAAAPVQGQGWPVVFNNYCTVGSYRVCASANLSLSGDGKTLTMDFWNNEVDNDPLDPYGIASTITAVGLYHDPAITLNLPSAPTLRVQYFSAPSTFLDVAAHWTLGDNSIGNLGGVRLDGYQYGATRRKPLTGTLGAGTDHGNHYGIVGCTDPTPGANGHLSTCRTSALHPFVRFSFDFGEDIGSAYPALGLNMRFHAQQLYDGNSVKCDTGIGSGPHACARPPTVTPEPATLALLGTGLAGVLGLRRRRRRREE